MTILRLIPLLLGWLGCFTVVRELAAREKIPAGWRLNVILATVLWGALLTWLVELGSRFHCLNFLVLTAAWLGAGLGLLGLSWHLSGKRGVNGNSFWNAPSPSRLACWPRDAKLMLGAAALIVLTLGLIGFFTPTTNYDSLTYHLPRVMHWIQHQSVEPYATSDTRQLESAPWAAFVLLNLHLLAGDDQCVNLLQWWMMLVSILAGTLLAEQFMIRQGGRDEPSSDQQARAATLCGLLTATLPIGVVQAITTQNDYVTSSWLMCLVALTLLLLREPSNPWLSAGAALAFGLGLLTKATFLLYAAPIALFFLPAVLARLSGAYPRILLMLMFVTAVLAVNGPQFLRNEALFGSPLASRYMFALQRNETLTVRGTVSNLVRNLSLHAATGWAPLTKGINRLLELTHGLSGQALDDRRTTIANASFAFQTGFPISDNQTGAFHHLLLILAAGVTLLWARVPGRQLMLVVYGLAAVSLVGFCAYLRWQPWHARFHLPYLLLALPAVAVVATVKWPRRLNHLIAVGLVALAFVCIGWNKSRPLLTGSDFLFQPREQQYLLEVPDLYYPLVQVADDIAASGCSRVGLRVRHDFQRYLDEVEYPHWVLLRNRGFTGAIKHVLFENESAHLAAPLGNFDAVITSVGLQASNLTQTMPYRVAHDPYAVYWNDTSSRWAWLELYTETSRARLPPKTNQVRFAAGGLDLGLHAGRPGLLKLQGRLADQGQAAQPARLFVKTDAGHVRLASFQPPRFELEIPAPEGATPIHLELLPGAGANRAGGDLRELVWTWKPVNTPLPWAYLTRLRASWKTGQPEAQTWFTLGRAPATVEVVAGAPGQIEFLAEMAFESGSRPNDARTIQLAAHTGYRAQVQVRAGQNLLRVPALQGTNAIAFAWTPGEQERPDARITVTSLELRFRLPEE